MRTLRQALIPASIAGQLAIIAFPAAAGSALVDARWGRWGWGGYPYIEYAPFYGYGYYPSGYGAYGYPEPYYGRAHFFVYSGPPHGRHRGYPHTR